MKFFNILGALIIFALPVFAGAVEMASIQSGSYRPLYLKKNTPLIPVKAFQMDKTPVTNKDFFEFIQKNPQWQRGMVKHRQAENQYLIQWVRSGKGYAPKSKELNYPVTNVSWFAANAYCQAQGKRLPTIDEWEYVGQASALKKNGTDELGYNRTILDWYAKGRQLGLRNVGQGTANYWGVKDMHGLIWEWTEDFNSSLLNAGSTNSDLFCGGGAANTTDPSNYAAFMRYGTRTSLQANYTQHNLGFRCAK